MVVPGQPWLDGFCVKRGVIRQFVAAPLGSGDTVEEQLSGKAEHGGLQIVAYPIKAEVWERILAERAQRSAARMEFSLNEADICYSAAPSDMGLAAGGRMRQEIYEDSHAFEAWDLRNRSRCFVHLANSLAWRRVTGENPPTKPPTAEDYTRAGLPWFDYYDADRKALEGSSKLAEVRPVGEEWDGEDLWTQPLIDLSPKKKRTAVREGEF